MESDNFPISTKVSDGFCWGSNVSDNNRVPELSGLLVSNKVCESSGMADCLPPLSLSGLGVAGTTQKLLRDDLARDLVLVSWGRSGNFRGVGERHSTESVERTGSSLNDCLK